MDHTFTCVYVFFLRVQIWCACKGKIRMACETTFYHTSLHRSRRVSVYRYMYIHVSSDNTCTCIELTSYMCRLVTGKRPRPHPNSTNNACRNRTPALITLHVCCSEAVPPDVYRGKPMCMSQFDLFQKCRIPRADVDESQQTPITESRHILVIRNGHVSYKN